MQINDLLKMAVSQGASDLHLKAGSVPVLRINGELMPQQSAGIVTGADMDTVFRQIASIAEQEIFAAEMEADFSYEAKDAGRFRVNVSRQDGTIAIAFRPIAAEIPSIEELGLPQICKELALKSSGLVIITGPTGCGKSTTLAAMMNYLNHTVKRRIIIITDPVEHLHRDIKCMFSQREIGRDTKSFANALKHAMRQDPDIILVGEMRDLETMAAVLTAAETGHLVLTTLHTPGTAQTIDRFVDIFPPHQQQQVRTQLASVLEGVVYQVLLPKKDGSGRTPAVEVMIATPAIRNLIRESKTYQMMNVIQTGGAEGMQTLNQSLVALCGSGAVAPETALACSNEPEDLKELLKGHKAKP